MRNRSLAETLVFVNLLFISCLSVRACSGVHDRVRGCFGTVRVLFGLLVFALLLYITKNRTLCTELTRVLRIAGI